MSSNIQVQRICQHCGNEFTARTTVTRFCSHRCASAAHKQKVRAGKVEQSNKETQRIKNQPIEELKAKPFLSIAETCKLIGISRRTVYRMIERGELITGKAGKRTIIRRSDLEQLLFEQPRTVAPQPENQPVYKSSLILPTVTPLPKYKANTGFQKQPYKTLSNEMAYPK